MSAADYRIKVGFFRHIKTKKLARDFGDSGVVALMSLWEYAAEFRTDGDLSGMSDEDLCLAINWNGDPSIIPALAAIGFLDGQEGGYELHDWAEHNPWAAEAEDRSSAARLSRLFRKNPDVARQLKEQGRTGISADEYRHYERGTPVVRPYNDRSTNAQRPALTPAPVPAPAPAPAPVPAPSPKEEKAAKRVCTAQARNTPTAKTGFPLDLDLTASIQVWADERGFADLDKHLDHFRDKALANGYRYADWSAAFKTAVRDDWAKLRTQPTIPQTRKPFTAHERHAALHSGNSAAIAEWMTATTEPVVATLHAIPGVTAHECH